MGFTWLKYLFVCLVCVCVMFVVQLKHRSAQPNELVSGMLTDDSSLILCMVLVGKVSNASNGIGIMICVVAAVASHRVHINARLNVIICATCLISLVACVLVGSVSTPRVLTESALAWCGLVTSCLHLGSTRFASMQSRLMAVALVTVLVALRAGDFMLTPGVHDGRLFVGLPVALVVLHACVAGLSASATKALVPDAIEYQHQRKHQAALWYVLGWCVILVFLCDAYAFCFVFVHFVSLFVRHDTRGIKPMAPGLRP